MKSNSMFNRTMVTKRRMILTTLLFLLLTTTVSIYSETLSTAWIKLSFSYRWRSWFRSEDPKNYAGKKKVLFWNTMFGDEWFYMGKDKHFDGCPKYNNCYATNWREMINVTDFDAILFHFNEMSRYDLPERRDAKQLYVFADLESPVNYQSLKNYLYLENFFNLTMTYRLDSDIPWPYRMLTNIDGDREYVAPSKNVVWKETSLDLLRRKLVDTKIDGKRKTAVWFVSNCETSGKRELFVEELSKHVDVDLIGSCARWGAPSCSPSKDCFAELVEPNYFFYLAFENALCDDYVTEKLYNPLR